MGERVGDDGCCVKVAANSLCPRIGRARGAKPQAADSTPKGWLLHFGSQDLPSVDMFSWVKRHMSIAVAIKQDMPSS